jgi:hypothetical protein
MNSRRHLPLSASEGARRDRGNPPRSHRRRAIPTTSEGKAAQFVIDDPPRQRLRALAKQFRRGAAEQQKARGLSRAVRQHSQDGEQLRPALYFINNDQAMKALESQRGVRQAGQIVGVFEIEEGGRTPAAGCNLAGQRGLAHLARAHDGHYRMASQQPLQRGILSLALEHALQRTLKSRTLQSNFQGRQSAAHNLRHVAERLAQNAGSM